MKNEREIYIKAFESVAKQASEGHYLTRLIAIMDALKLYAHTDLLLANKMFLENNHKPAGLDELMEDCSNLVVACALRAGCTVEDFKPIAWGLDLNVLEQNNLQSARSES